MRAEKRAGLVLAVVLLASLSRAAGGPSATLVTNFDLDGKAGAVGAIVTTATIVDSTSYTIAAQPDIPRILEVTVVDADSSITAGVLTVTGIDADGKQIVGTATLSGGSGVKAISPTLYFASVSTAVTGVITGESGAPDTLSLDTDANSTGVPVVYPMAAGFDRQNSLDLSETWDPFAWRPEPRKAKTSGLSASLTSNTASGGAFTAVAPGDLLLFSNAREQLGRVVVTKADNDNITVESPIDLSAGFTFQYRKLHQLNGAEAGWVGVRGYGSVTYVIDIVQLVGTGGIDDYVQCRIDGSGAPAVNVFQDNLAATGRTVYSIDLRIRGYDRCRFGLRWATNDDANDLTTNTEQITVQMSLAELVR